MTDLQPYKISANEISSSTKQNNMIQAIEDQFNIVNAKGDLIVATADNTLARHAVGANDNLLVADSAQTNGIKWAQVANAHIASNAAIATTKLATVQAARVLHNANQSITSSASTVIAFNSERFDTDGIHDNATNNSRLTCNTAGIYLIGACVQWAGNATGSRYTALKLNGTTYIGITHLAAGYAGEIRMDINSLYSLSAADFVEVEVFQDSGGALDVVAFGNFSPEFWMVRLGAA